LTESGILLIPSVRRLSSDRSLVLAATLVVASNSGSDIIVKVITVFVAVTLLVFRRWDPETGLPVIEGLVLAGEIDALALMTVAAALGESAGALGELGGDGGVLGDPVGKSILAVLDDTI
jgi:hypothetical protein